MRRGSELRSQLILSVFAVERFLRFLVFAGAAYELPAIRAIGLAAYALIELVEGTGL